jgi:hypothetical protein
MLGRKPRLLLERSKAMEALTGMREIERAFRKFNRRMAAAPGACHHQGTITYRPGSVEADITWHPELGIWWHLEEMEDRGRYWNCFGTENPLEKHALNITCEINMPMEGMNRRLGGAFARDHRGVAYLTHSGGICGGRQGIGKTMFWRLFRGYHENSLVQWPDGKETRVVVISSLDHADLQKRVADFTKEVQRIKDLVTTPKSPKRSPRTRLTGLRVMRRKRL